MEGNSTTYFFSDNFPKFSVQLFQNTLIKWSVMKFSRVLFYIKKWLHQGQFLEIIPSKNLWWIPILVATCNICKNRLVYRRCLSGYFEKYVQSMESCSSILVKNTLSLDLLALRVCWRRSIPLATLRKFLESLFIKNLQAFLVNDGEEEVSFKT